MLQASSDLAEGEVDILKTKISGTEVGLGHRFIRFGGGGVLGDPRVVRLLGAGTSKELETGAINPEYLAGGFLTYQFDKGDEVKMAPHDGETGTGWWSEGWPGVAGT